MAELFDRAIVGRGMFAKNLAAAGLSSRTANAIAFASEITSIDELRSAPWGDGKPSENAGLWWQLQVTPNLGPKGIAQVLALRNGDNPGEVRSAIGNDPLIATRMSVALVSDLDRWATTNGYTRPEAIRRLIEAGLAAAKVVLDSASA